MESSLKRLKGFIMKKIQNVDDIELSGVHDHDLMHMLKTIAVLLVRINKKLEDIQDDLDDWPKGYDGLD